MGQGREHVDVVGLAGTGDVEGGAVVDRVRSIGRPSETLTAVSKATSLIGMWPWSWYWATTRSKAPL